MDNNEIDYKRAAEQLRKGEPLFGKNGALAPMLERILNAALEGEMDAHLSIDERSKGNRRNGKLPKQVQTCYGEVTVETPRDRDGSFEPQTVRKRETILAEGIHYEVKDETGRAVSRAIYNVLGINKEGHKELLGMYVSKSEGANFWLEVLSDLQNRGVQDN